MKRDLYRRKRTRGDSPRIARSAPTFLTRYPRSSETSESGGPTDQIYSELRYAYDYFNTVLFRGVLPPCLITLQRHRHALGFFAGGRFANSEHQLADEIALNPSGMSRCSIIQILSVLVHEQCHLWQFHFSEYDGRRGIVRPYHDREWGSKMESIGLIPTNTGKPGGKRTGRHVSHYIVSSGRFAVACATLLSSGFSISWMERVLVARD